MISWQTFDNTFLAWNKNPLFQVSYWKHILKDSTYYLPNKGLLTRTAPRILFIILERKIGSFVPCYLHNNTCPWSVRCLPLTCRWMMEEKKNVSSGASIYFKSLSLHLNDIKNLNSRYEYELFLRRRHQGTSCVLTGRTERKTTKYISYQLRNQLCW